MHDRNFMAKNGESPRYKMKDVVSPWQIHMYILRYTHIYFCIERIHVYVLFIINRKERNWFSIEKSAPMNVIVLGDITDGGNVWNKRYVMVNILIHASRIKSDTEWLVRNSTMSFHRMLKGNDPFQSQLLQFIYDIHTKNC